MLVAVPYGRRMTALLRTSAAVLLATLALAACGTDEPSDRAGEEPTSTQSETPAASGEVTVAGTWGEPVDDAPHLVLGADGRVSGSDGCNRLMSSWQAEGGTVTFDAVAGTRKACPDVDTWLSAMATATVEGDTLTVLDQDGEPIGTLARH